MDGSRGASYLPAAWRIPLLCASTGIDVTHQEFEAFLREYPRPLEARPPMGRKARFREWVDLTLGPWPEGSVAKTWSRGSCKGYQVRVR